MKVIQSIVVLALFATSADALRVYEDPKTPETTPTKGDIPRAPVGEQAKPLVKSDYMKNPPSN